MSTDIITKLSDLSDVALTKQMVDNIKNILDRIDDISEPSKKSLEYYFKTKANKIRFGLDNKDKGVSLVEDMFFDSTMKKVNGEYQLNEEQLDTLPVFCNYFSDKKDSVKEQKDNILKVFTNHEQLAKAIKILESGSQYNIKEPKSNVLKVHQDVGYDSKFSILSQLMLVSNESLDNLEFMPPEERGKITKKAPDKMFAEKERVIESYIDKLSKDTLSIMKKLYEKPLSDMSKKEYTANVMDALCKIADKASKDTSDFGRLKNNRNIEDELKNRYEYDLKNPHVSEQDIVLSGLVTTKNVNVYKKVGDILSEMCLSEEQYTIIEKIISSAKKVDEKIDEIADLLNIDKKVFDIKCDADNKQILEFIGKSCKATVTKTKLEEKKIEKKVADEEKVVETEKKEKKKKEKKVESEQESISKEEIISSTKEQAYEILSNIDFDSITKTKTGKEKGEKIIEKTLKPIVEKVNIICDVKGCKNYKIRGKSVESQIKRLKQLKQELGVELGKIEAIPETPEIPETETPEDVPIKEIEKPKTVLSTKIFLPPEPKLTNTIINWLNMVSDSPVICTNTEIAKLMESFEKNPEKQEYATKLVDAVNNISKEKLDDLRKIDFTTIFEIASILISKCENKGE